MLRHFCTELFLWKIESRHVLTHQYLIVYDKYWAKLKVFLWVNQNSMCSNWMSHGWAGQGQMQHHHEARINVSIHRVEKMADDVTSNATSSGEFKDRIIK